MKKKVARDFWDTLYSPNGGICRGSFGWRGGGGFSHEYTINNSGDVKNKKKEQFCQTLETTALWPLFSAPRARMKLSLVCSMPPLLFLSRYRHNQPTTAFSVCLLQ